MMARLEREGFISIEIDATSRDSLYIYYENRVYRNEVFAAGALLSAIDAFAGDSVRIFLTPRRQGISLGTVAVKVSDYRSFIAGRLTEEQFRERLDFSCMDHPTPVRGIGIRSKRLFPLMDLTIHPSFTIQLGNYDDAVKFDVGMAPELSLDLWRGASVAARVLLPLYDELRLYTLEPRMVRLTVGQTLHLRQAGWLFARFGVFEPDRWGIAGEWARFVFRRSVMIGCKGEYTGFYLQQQGVTNYSSWQTGTSQFYAVYFAPRYDFFVRVSYDRYLFSERGYSLQVSRKFADLEIGFLAAKTNIDDFGGLLLRIPLAPRKDSRPRTLRMKLPEYHTWRYSTTSLAHTQGQTVQTGVIVNSGPEAIEWFHFFMPSYIKNNIVLWRTAAALSGGDSGE